jgi:multidrug resistance efflux pump
VALNFYVTVNLATSDQVDKIERMLTKVLSKEDQIMATVQEVKAAVAAEKAEVLEKLTQLLAQIEELKLKGAATAEELGEIETSVRDIFTAELPPAP